MAVSSHPRANPALVTRSSPTRSPATQPHPPRNLRLSPGLMWVTRPTCARFRKNLGPPRPPTTNPIRFSLLSLPPFPRHHLPPPLDSPPNPRSCPAAPAVIRVILR